MFLNCGNGEDSLNCGNGESLGLQGDTTINPQGNQSWIFIGRTDAEAETPILWPPDAKNWHLKETLMLGKIEGRRRARQRVRCLDSITNSMDSSPPGRRPNGHELVMDWEAWCAAVHAVTESWTWLSDWTELNWRLRWEIWCCCSCCSVVLGNSYFCLAAFKGFSFFLVFEFLIMMCPGVSFFGSVLFWFCCFLNLSLYVSYLRHL